MFLRFSFLHELITAKLGFNPFLALIFGVPALLFALITGSFQRTIRHKPGIFFTGFACWLVISIPFSTWPGGSTSLVMGYLRTEFPLVFIIGGLVMTYEECAQMFSAIALAGVFTIITGKFFGGFDPEGRLGLALGSIGNANDYAAHAILVMPFVGGAMVLTKAKWKKLACLSTLLLGCYLAALTGSRGGLVGLLAGLVFLTFFGGNRIRAAVFLGVPALALCITPFLSRSVVLRYAMLFTNVQATDAETGGAVGSSEARSMLFHESLGYTLHNPIFGLGPGQFSIVAGRARREAGSYGDWQVAHNSYTQASSEAGLPGVILMSAGLFSAFVFSARVFRKCPKRVPALRDLRVLSFCLMLAILMYAICIAFLSHSYNFTLPALGGLSIALTTAAHRRLNVAG